MKIVELTEEQYDMWDEFCLKSDEAWFWHTTGWLKYTLNLTPQFKTKNLGFFVLEEREVIAIVPLTLETHGNDKEFVHEFSYGGDFIPGPALRNNLHRDKRESVLNFIFEEIEKLACQKKVVRSKFRLTPISNSSLSQSSFNYFMKYGYISTSLNTQLIDLTKSKDELWRDLRRNHRRNIEKGSRFNIKFYNHENITESIFKNYQEMHHRAAGRKTRPNITFQMMYDMILNNTGFLVVVELGGKLISFELYINYKDSVYGASAANDPDYEYLPIRHFLEWEAILWMKRNEFNIYEIGLQQYSILPYDFPDKKQEDISHFKKGFGGFTVPIFRGEKYYSKDFFERIEKERKEKFLASYDFNYNYRVGALEENDKDLPTKKIKETTSVPLEHLEDIINIVIEENKEIFVDIKNNPKSINYIMGQIKRRVKGHYDFKVALKILQTKAESADS